MRSIAFILTLVFAISMFIPAQVEAETQVRVYWGVGIVVGGLSIFLSFGSGDLSKKESEVRTAEAKPSESLLLARSITENADIHPVHYKTPGTLTVLRW